MIWNVKKVNKPELEVLVADSDLFCQIVSITFHFSEPVIKGIKLLLDKAEAENYLVYLNGKPAGAGTLLLDSNIGVILNVATLFQYQKRGCGRSLMLFLMNRAHELKLKHLILAASPMSEKLYSDLGFKKEFDIEIYAH